MAAIVDDEQEKVAGNTPEEQLCARIRERYDYYLQSWREIREERTTDMRYVLGDPWDAADKKARADAGRPCISHDELNQYINQAVNGIRQNPRGVKVEPAGEGATDKTAQFDQDLVRAIEYRSQGIDAYLTAYQGAVEGSYGFFGVSRKYVSDKSFDQEIGIRNIPNPDSVLYDPDFRMADASDATGCFVLEPMSKEEFKRRFPNAKKVSFTTEDARVAPQWIQDKLILVAEYWEVKTESATLYLLEDGTATYDLPKGAKYIKKRAAVRKTLTQYLTNGIEILEENPQPGDEIPIIPVFGKEIYIDEGSGPTRKLMSLVRLARDPQMSLAYLVSQEMEEAGLTPKVPWVGYVGQFETDAESWDNLGTIPRSRVQADPVVDQATGQVLPLPTRVQFTPNFQSYELAKEACRRAIQAAFGIMPLPTVAQEQNQKSGVALNKIQSQQAVGSYHLVAALERAVRRCGRIILKWKKPVYDTERVIPLRRADDTQYTVRINTQEPYADEKSGEMVHYPIEEIDHDVTVSVGPSNESTKEAASDFLDALIGNLKMLPVAPPQAAKLLSLAIKGKQLGPLGDQMSELIAPDENQEIPPQAQAAIAQLQAQLQQAQAIAQQLGMEKQTKQWETEQKATLESIKSQMQIAIETMKLENQRAIAEIQTKSQDVRERTKLAADLDEKERVRAHEVAMTAVNQQHEADMAEQAHQSALDQQVNQAALQPPPEPAQENA